VDGSDVGRDKYKNRLWAFAKARGVRAREEQFLATEEIDALCGRVPKYVENPGAFFR